MTLDLKYVAYADRPRAVGPVSANRDVAADLDQNTSARLDVIGHEICSERLRTRAEVELAARSEADVMCGRVEDDPSSSEARAWRYSSGVHASRERCVVDVVAEGHEGGEHRGVTEPVGHVVGLERREQRSFQCGAELTRSSYIQHGDLRVVAESIAGTIHCLEPVPESLLCERALVVALGSEGATHAPNLELHCSVAVLHARRGGVARRLGGRRGRRCRGVIGRGGRRAVRAERRRGRRGRLSRVDRELGLGGGGEDTHESG